MATDKKWLRKFEKELKKNLKIQRLAENLAYKKLYEACDKIAEVRYYINNYRNKKVRKYLPKNLKIDFFTVYDNSLKDIVKGYLQRVIKELNECRQYHTAVKEVAKSVKNRIFQLRCGKGEVLLEHEREWINNVEKIDEVVLGIIEDIHETMGLLDEKPLEIEEEIALHDRVVMRAFDHNKKINDCLFYIHGIKRLEIEVQMDEDKLKND